MPNDMMIAALNSQRNGKVDSPGFPEKDQESGNPGKPNGIEDRISALESKYDELCKLVGMDDKETPQAAPRGY